MSRSLPPGWVWASPEDVARRSPHALAIGPFGSNLKVADYRSSGVPLVFVRHIRAERFVDTHFISEAKAKELASHSVAGGDVLITKMGEPPGDSAIYPLHLPDGVITADCIKWSIDPRVGQPKFFMYALRSSELRQRIIAVTQGVAQKKVSLARFRTIKFPCAPRDEQARLVDALDSQQSRLDAAVASLTSAQAKLKAYRASVLKAAVEGRLVPTEAELAGKEGRSYEPANVLLSRILEKRRRRWEEAELAKMKAAGRTPIDDKWKGRYEAPNAPPNGSLPALPDGWCWATVDQLAALEENALCDGPFGSNLKTEHYTEQGPRVVRLQNIGDGEFLDAEAHISERHFERLRKHALRAGDLVVASLGTELPRVCTVPEWLGPAIVKADCLRFRVNESLADSMFVLHALNAPDTRKRVEAHVHGVGRPRIGLTLFRQTAVPLPPRAEQERIVECVEAVASIAKKTVLEIQRDTLRCARLRQAVLRWAFEGKLAEQDPADEPAEHLLTRIRADHAAAAPAKKARGRRSKTKL